MIVQKPPGSSYFSEIQRLRRQNLRLGTLNRELKTENNLLNQLVGSTKVGMFVKNEQNAFVYVNQAFCDHLQVSRNKILFKENQQLSKSLRRYINDDKKVLKTRNVVFNLIENKDRSSWIETVKFPWFAPPNQIKGIYGFTNDVSDNVRVEEGLHKTRVDLKKANLVNEALRQFSYAASHDLQEPLRSVQGILNIIQLEFAGQLDQKAKVYFDKADESLQRMQQLIKDILDYAAINGVKYRLELVDLNLVLDQVLLNLHQTIQEQQAQISVDRLPQVNGNSGLLIHYFQNMLSNSIKYQSSGVSPKVRITSQSNRGNWIIGIEDNGIGIDPSYFNEIFKPFKRLHRQSEIKGSGIGLATSKKIVQIHSGRLWVESSLGSGSTFFMEIPKNMP